MLKGDGEMFANCRFMIILLISCVSSSSVLDAQELNWAAKNVRKNKRVDFGVVARAADTKISTEAQKISIRKDVHISNVRTNVWAVRRQVPRRLCSKSAEEAYIEIQMGHREVHATERLERHNHIRCTNFCRSPYSHHCVHSN